MLKVKAIPVFEDNYIWVVIHNNDALVVDPGDDDSVNKFIINNGLILRYILITHWHPDHTGGVKGLIHAFPAVKVVGPRQKVPLVSHPVDDNESLWLFEDEVRVIATPGHTLEHISFYFVGMGWLFCGDTLFAGGCGRIFEGDAAMMYHSLHRLMALPGDTLVYCAHEYTQNNLRFAQAAEPDNQQIRQRLIDVDAKRNQGLPTVPSTLEEERETNPFLRVDRPAVISTARRHSDCTTTEPEAVFAALRSWKDDFK